MTTISCDNYDCKWCEDGKCVITTIDLNVVDNETGYLICTDFERY